MSQNNELYKIIQEREDQFDETISELVASAEKESLTMAGLALYIVKTAFNLHSRLWALTKITKNLSKQR